MYRIRNILPYSLILFLFLFFCIFLFLPVLLTISEGCSPAIFREVLKNRLYMIGLGNATLIAIITTILVLFISLPLAFLYDKYDFPGKNICPVIMMAPIILPPFVGALGFQQLLGHFGLLNSILTYLGLSPVDWLGGNGRFYAICIMEALHLYPIMYLNLITSLANIDPCQLEAAKNAGASSFHRFTKIIFPLMHSGLMAGVSLVLIWSFTELGTPMMFGFNTITPVQIYNGLMELGTNHAAYGLVVIMLSVALILYLGTKILFGRNNTVSSSKGTPGSHALPMIGIKRFLPITAFLTFTFIAILPHVCLVLIAFSSSWNGTILPHEFSLLHFNNALSDELVVPSIINSLRYSCIAVIISVLLGVAIAFLNHRTKIKGIWLLDLIAMVPLMIPGIVMAVGFLGMTIKYKWAEALFNPITNPVLLLSIAYAVRRIPYVLRSASSGLQQIPTTLEEASHNSGASMFRTFWKITLPLIMANLIVGGLFAFSFSMLEVSDSLILAQKTDFYPITKAIYELSMFLGSGPCTAAAFGVWAMLFLASTLIAASFILGKKIGSLFSI